MTWDPPSSNSESDVSTDIGTYVYKSEGEEMLGNTAHALLEGAGGNHRLARAAILAYTRLSLCPLLTPLQQNEKFPQTAVILCRRNIPCRHDVLRCYNIPCCFSGSIMLLECPPTSSRAAVCEHSRPQLTRNEDAPREEPGTLEFRPMPITDKSRFQTLLYPLLRDSGLLQYFQMEDGVSKRPANNIREMLRQISLDRTWLGDTSYVNTTNVVSPQRRIQQPATTVHSSCWYIVIMGTDIGIFSSWTDAGPYVQNVSGAVHRYFNTKREAYRSLQYALLLGTACIFPA
ncbi:hypothetical protein BJ322DRAFT_1102817 [Thelephora terrestris]|uniref:Ribonuclease H1 N-terminal domain-containing protein n=1 Tax=Thelephora terrestris TaxID=56493 RepID=A0A9P6LCG9_9AGAM|nr:hypothetical protein BJ322DRAFT_1102817 [Thelephora terrestris]